MAKKKKKKRMMEDAGLVEREPQTITRKPKVLLLPLQRHNCLVSMQWQLANKCRNFFLLLNHKGLENFYDI